MRREVLPWRRRIRNIPVRFAGLEVLFALLVLPFALVYRKLRGAWPVEVHDADDRLLKRVPAPDWTTAGRWIQQMRDEILASQYGLAEDGGGSMRG